MEDLIEFTQYKLPSGRREQVYIRRTPQVREKAAAIVKAGYALECEVLLTGQASFTITDHEAGEDVAIELVQNGPDVPAAVDRLILGFEIPATTSDPGLALRSLQRLRSGLCPACGEAAHAPQPCGGQT